MKKTPGLIPCLISLLWTISACSAGTGSGNPAAASGMHVTKTCTETTCEVERSIRGTKCSECTRLCFDTYSDCDPEVSCKYSCKTYECTSEQISSCEKAEFSVTLPADVDASIENACNAFVSHANECGWKSGVDASQCKTRAHVYTAEAAKLFDCEAKLPCDATDASSCAIAPTNFGDALCVALGPCTADFDGLCSTDGRAGLAAAGALLRPDVMATAIECAHESNCNEVVQCIMAWSQAVWQ